VKPVREQLRTLLESEGEIRKLVIVYQKRGKKAEAVHNFESTAKAIAFVSENLRLSDQELLGILRGRI
jgi:hypothetical protein